MIDWTGLVLALAGGAVTGAAHLGLLWAGVRGLAAGRGGARFLALAALRAGLILGALALGVAAGLGAGGMLAGLVGFLAVRIAVTRRAEARDAGETAWR